MSSQEINKLFECIPQPGIDFEYCAVKQTVTKKFPIQNTTSQQVTLTIKEDSSERSQFVVEPKTCKLPFSN